jgi:hypothetical protein
MPITTSLATEPVKDLTKTSILSQISSSSDAKLCKTCVLLVIGSVNELVVSDHDSLTFPNILSLVNTIIDGCLLYQLIVDFLRIDAEKPVPKDVPVKLRSSKTRAIMPAGVAGFIFGVCFGDTKV